MPEPALPGHARYADCDAYDGFVTGEFKADGRVLKCTNLKALGSSGDSSGPACSQLAPVGEGSSNEGIEGVKMEYSRVKSVPDALDPILWSATARKTMKMNGSWSWS